MESFKANLIVFLFILAIAGLAFWAVQELRSGTDTFIVENMKEDVAPIVTSSADDLITSPSTVEIDTSVDEGNQETPPQDTTVSSGDASTDDASQSSGKHADLIAKLQKLIDDKILMKKGSQGTRVGTVQEFLNLYNGTDARIDNDYGDTTANAIKKFQSEQGLSADGQAGTGTYAKMIEWLKAN